MVKLYHKEKKYQKKRNKSLNNLYFSFFNHCYLKKINAIINNDKILFF